MEAPHKLRPIIPFVIPKSTHMKVWLNEERTFPFYSVHNPLFIAECASKSSPSHFYIAWRAVCNSGGGICSRRLAMRMRWPPQRHLASTTFSLTSVARL
jgi:hypothetical protein